jgi:sec-independent protein translocase protein TatA
MFKTMGFAEIMLILGIAFLVFVVFGPKNLPKLGKMFGSTMKEVRKGMSEFSEEMNDASGSSANDEAEDQSPAEAIAVDAVEIEPGRKVAKIIYEDEVEA